MSNYFNQIRHRIMKVLRLTLSMLLFVLQGLLIIVAVLTFPLQLILYVVTGKSAFSLAEPMEEMWQSQLDKGLRDF